jgi:lactobin A/cerein 7B family class IIb bacteriocin
MKNYNLKELDKQELINIEGGIIHWILGVAAYVAKQCIDDWPCFKDGLSGRVNNHK